MMAAAIQIAMVRRGGLNSSTAIPNAITSFAIIGHGIESV